MYAISLSNCPKLSDNLDRSEFFVFYEGTTAVRIPLNDEKFGMLYGNDKNSICVYE